MTVLVTGPGGPDPSNAVLREVGRVVRDSTLGSIAIVEVWDADATRARVDAEMGQQPDVMFFGHGSETALGHPEVLVDANNIGQARGRVVLAMACWSASDLGVYAVHSSRVAAYLGFARPVVVPFGKYAHWSIPPWAAAGIALLAGATAAEAAEALRGALDAEADRILNDVKWPAAVEQSNQLRGIARAFTCLGDPAARLGI